MDADQDRIRLARALAEFWAGGAGPSHGDISRALDSVDLEEDEPTGNKRDRVQAAVAQVDSQKLSHLVEVLVEMLVHSGSFDGQHKASDTIISLLQKRLLPYRMTLRQDGTLLDSRSLGTTPETLLSLPILHDHISRMRLALHQDDSALLLGSSKELLESTSKFVLGELNLATPSEFPSLLSAALTAVGLHPKSVQLDGEGAAATKRILGGLQQIGTGVNELRNDHGTGHGRATNLKLGLRHARLAAGAAIVLATTILDTFEDPTAPWRRATNS